MTTPSHPDGTIAAYTDALNRSQLSVDGPKGHILVTAGRRGTYGPTFDVWRSDSIKTILSRTDHKRAIRAACWAAGLDPALIVWPAPADR